ncbi:type III-B CRISPR module RAMP protein Cmr1 [Bacillus sp. HMF5848]|uniref:type III-B CRISPR module RAMP protein Cmr1 n=1 Tax=Bacillus sp. HMF5848 TaxID=2495421 RepID=UPI000F7A2F65|nr:type III-B CRISPR module RAMP protein Cmr1 [Bacillus sp. HMF5848]RSK26554.1 type III-B CRISPR module RAMP protein Cmr1 [Bacillus sp. HMF5848]
MIDLEQLSKASSKVEKNYDLQLITTLLMHGSELKKEAEVRIPSIKGVYRYWWRSLQHDISAEKLLEMEKQLFGGATSGKENRGNKSIVTLTNTNLTDRLQMKVCPHKQTRFSSPGIKSGEEFTINLLVNKKDENSLTMFDSYLQIMFMLSGFGQRSRRGAGALQLKKHNWTTIGDFQSELKNLLTLVKKDVYFTFPSDRAKSCILECQRNTSNHPILTGVWIGRPFENDEIARTSISEAGHEANPGGKKQFLGSAKPRQASPLHGTVRKIGHQYYPIISEVITGKDMNSKYIDARNKFLDWLGVRL